jgi:hypothetical protein
VASVENDSNGQKLKVNQETMDVLVANVIPTTKYFETRFDFLQYQVNEVKEGLKKTNESIVHLEDRMNARFE